MTARRLLLVCFASWLCAASSDAQDQTPSGRQFDRSRLPAALQNVPLDRLSSGALLRLDLDGDLVETEAAHAARVAAIESAGTQQRKAAVALDPRVGANIRLGDDPAALPPTRRAQAEPHIARAPGDSDFLLATFQEGRFGDGGAADCGYSVSHDGGLTWTRALIPNLGAPTGGPYERATDPVAGIDRAGNAYLNTLGLVTRTTSQGNPDFDGSILISRSTDGGATFGSPVLVYKEPNADTFADKNWMAINTFPGTATPLGRIVITYTIFSNIGGVNHAIMRSYSDNQGATWSPAQYIHSPNQQVQGSVPVFLRGGRLAVSYWNFRGTTSFVDDRLELVVSDDGGVTFGAPKVITNVAHYDHPNIRDGSFLPQATTDRETGTLYIVYQAIHNGVARIMFTKSANAGTTWTTPIPISDNPPGSGVFTSTIGASPDGQTLTAVFYSNRDNPGSNTRVDMYLSQSFNGGATWQPNIRLTSVSTNAELAVNTGTVSNPNYMLGDYIGIAESTNVNVPAVPVWIDTRTGNPDPFVTRVGIAPQVDFTSWQAARLSLGQINHPQLGGEAGDADGDFEDNLSEYRSGTEPNDALSVFRTGRQLNLSTRTDVLTGDNVLIGGFIVTGDNPKKVILRALGPSLVGAGVAGRLEDPTIELVRGGVTVAANDNWKESQQTEIENTGIPPADERESAVVQTLLPGDYTAVVRGKADTTGVALVEMYDLEPNTPPRLANVSSRGFVGTNEGVMIGGFIVGAGQGKAGAGSARVILRGIGPSLSESGTANPLQDPELLLFDGNGSMLASNDNWRQTQQIEIEATGIAPRDDREAALVTVLRQGSYTAILRGRNGTTGVGLVEAYNLQ